LYMAHRLRNTAVEDIANARFKIKPIGTSQTNLYLLISEERKREKKSSRYLLEFQTTSLCFFTSLHHYVLLFLQLQEMIIQNTYVYNVSQSMDC